jgi:hypothetical protein
MAVPSAAACEKALQRLGAALAKVDPDIRARRVPERTLTLRVSDLDVQFAGRLGPDGLTELRRVADLDGNPDPDVRLEADSGTVVEVADHPARFATAWLRGRIKVQAGVRDLLELRRLLM